jgi:hypothetical protein
MAVSAIVAGKNVAICERFAHQLLMSAYGGYLASAHDNDQVGAADL